jgi:ComF family protein
LAKLLIFYLWVLKKNNLALENWNMNYLTDFVALFFPRLCATCNNALLQHEEILCTLCLHQLPKTNFHTEENNAVSQIFWGRVPIEHTAAWCYFLKGGKMQHLIHLLKYNGRKEIGQCLGKIYGRDLMNTKFYQVVEVIVPVPLHPKRKRKRGYNQSEWIALGLSESMKIPVDTKTLIRATASESQTKKSRFSRWENVKEIFVVRDFKSLENKHILLVDDVLTTGATMESCATELLKIRGVKISVVALACSAK